jgi:hypothetical protein
LTFDTTVILHQDLTGKLEGEVAARRCYIGQPVALTAEECVVRVAAVWGPTSIYVNLNFFF